MLPTTDRRVHALGARTGGVVSTSVLVAAGLDPELPAREVAAGRWCCLVHGIYLTAPGPPDLAQRCHAAVLHGGRTALLTGLAGCRLRRTPGLPPELPFEPVHVRTAHEVRRVSTELVVVRRTRGPRTGHLIAGFAVAPVAACLVDAVRQVGALRPARSLVLRSVGAGRITVPELVGACAGEVRPPVLDRVLRDAADGARSAPEAELADVLHEAAVAGLLPSYLLNPELRLDGVLLGSPDAWLPGLGLGAEMDSREFHGDVDDLDATLGRHDRFDRAGLKLLHTTPRRSRADPQDMVRRLVAEVAVRRQLAAPEPEGLVTRAIGPLLPGPRARGRRAA